MKELMKAAEAALENSYSPYSGIRIGAAVECASGKIYTGTNVENASYGATICAERSAITSAVSAGEKKITAIAITGDIDDYAWPCGICRQVIKEFAAPDIKIAVSGRNREVKEFGMDEILPNAFEFNIGGNY
jgi:cytidine deaminase